MKTRVAPSKSRYNSVRLINTRRTSAICVKTQSHRVQRHWRVVRDRNVIRENRARIAIKAPADGRVSRFGRLPEQNRARRKKQRAEKSDEENRPDVCAASWPAARNRRPEGKRLGRFLRRNRLCTVRLGQSPIIILSDNDRLQGRKNTRLFQKNETVFIALSFSSNSSTRLEPNQKYITHQLLFRFLRVFHVAGTPAVRAITRRWQFFFSQTSARIP